MGCLLKHPIFLAFEKGARVDAPLLLVRTPAWLRSSDPADCRAGHRARERVVDGGAVCELSADPQPEVPSAVDPAKALGSNGCVPAQILQLHPQPGPMRDLEGTYLAHNLRALGGPGAPFVYANFVSSLDGRIAVIEPGTGESYTLEDLASSHDWRL